jgi:hypothetical protein
MSKIEPYIYPQGEWMNKRAGSFTSSQIGNLFTEPRSKAAKESGEMSETAKNYIMDKAAELLTGTIRNTYTTPEMQWGLDQEPYAIELLKNDYKGITYYGAENPKFFSYSDFSGGSPDAISYEDKIVFEIKCPNPRTHIENLLQDDVRQISKDYWYQIQMNIACVAHELDINPMNFTGVFASYCPLMIEPKLRLKKILVEPDAEFQSKLPKLIETAENHLRSIIDKFEL